MREAAHGPEAGGDVASSSGADGLASFRARLDAIDDAIARLFGQRFETCREIAQYKSEHDISMMQPGRVEDVRARYSWRGSEAGVPADFSAALFELVIAATCKMEDELIDGAAAAPGAGEASECAGGDR
jgi:4-amino-4-deoxychorismate mutase